MDFSNDLIYCINALQRGGTILYPTDTIWGLGCDATDDQAVDKIFAIKNRPDSKSLITLVDSLQMLEKYAGTIPKSIEDILQDSSRPTTIIYTGIQGFSKRVIAQDRTAAIRLVNDSFCKSLIREFGKPIVSTSANLSGFPSAGSYAEISSEIISQVDYCVKYRQTEYIQAIPSRIIKILGSEEIQVIRE